MLCRLDFSRIAAARRALLIGMIAVVCLHAHGLGVGVEVTDKSVILRARYADGMFPEADVEVYAPGETEKAFLLGKTGEDGVYSFVPNATGKWHVVVDDGMGHYKEVEVNIDGTTFVIADSSTPTTWRVLLGVAALAGLGLAISLIARKQKAARETSVERA